MICLHFVPRGPLALVHKQKTVKGKEFQPNVDFPLDLCVRARERQIESPVVTCLNHPSKWDPEHCVPGKGVDTEVPLQ